LEFIALDLRKTHFISSFIERTVIDISQLGCPPIAKISLPSISCMFACHNKFKHVCALRTAYTLPQWLYFYMLSTVHAKALLGLHFINVFQMYTLLERKYYLNGLQSTCLFTWV
jgi:hypothetical protein